LHNNRNKNLEVKIMTIEKTQNGAELNLKVVGRLDTTTAPQLEAEIKQLDGITNLIFDFEELEYLSSAGLRVLLTAQKTMNKQGEMIIKNVNDTITEIFEVTGFIDILTIE
jgi:anti-sigma B factor antagonist